jgi:hypothetical protein
MNHNKGWINRQIAQMACEIKSWPGWMQRALNSRWHQQTPHVKYSAITQADVDAAYVLFSEYLWNTGWCVQYIPLDGATVFVDWDRKQNVPLRDYQVYLPYRLSEHYHTDIQNLIHRVESARGRDRQVIELQLADLRRSETPRSKPRIFRQKLLTPPAEPVWCLWYGPCPSISGYQSTQWRLHVTNSYKNALRWLGALNQIGMIEH